MTFFPWENIEIKSSLTKAEVTNRIANSIVPPNRISNKDFEGQVDGNEFEISRILKSGRNSFIPIIHGQVIDTENGCFLKATIRLNKAVYTLLTFFILFDLTLLYFSFDISTILFLIAPYLMATAFFNIESNSAKLFLKRLIIK